MEQSARGGTDPLAEPLPEKSMSEGIRLIQRVARVVGRRAQPQMPACNLIAYRGDGLSVMLEHSRDRPHPELGAAYGCRFEHRTLLVCEPPYVPIDDAGQIFRDRGPPQSDRG